MKFIDLRNELRAMKSELAAQRSLYKVKYDPSDYIELWDGAQLVLVYRGVYFRLDDTPALSKVLGRTQVDIDSRTLKILGNDKSRWRELWALDIETHYMKLTKNKKYFVCSDGNVLKLNLSPLRHSYSGSYLDVVIDGEIFNPNRALMVFQYFIDEDIEENDIYFRNGLV